jgi:hypothetical protein
MPRKLTCSCGCQLVVPEEPVAASLRCPACWRQLPIPAADEAFQEAEAPPPPPPPTIEPAERGYELDAGKRRGARQLGMALALASLLNVAPAVIHVLEYARSDASQGVSPWACGLLLMGVVQLAYAFYAVQLPDWSTAWVVTLLTLAVAAVYAMLLAVVLSSTADGRIVHALQLSDLLGNGAAAAWCFAMLCFTGLFSYCSGRFAAGWRKVYESEVVTACSTSRS